MAIANIRTVRVGSHITEISFGGATIPIGYLATFRKKNHTDCATGGGFVQKFVPGTGRAQVLCSCATNRAAQKLRQVGATGLETLASVWLVEERKRIDANASACRDEGRQAPPKSACPYPRGTDQFLAWHEGRAAAVLAAMDASKEQPQEEGAFAEGVRAAAVGKPSLSNPHDQASSPDDHAAWSDGWESKQGGEAA